MKNIDELIRNAGELSDQGFSLGEIADELNVSRETANWLAERSTSATKTANDSSKNPSDIHVDWSTLGRDSKRLTYAGKAMADLLSKQGEEVDLTVGIEKAGTPLATVVAREMNTDIATYTPRKHQWEEGDIDDLQGTFSKNFSDLRGRDCYIVDDTITTGTTIQETVDKIKEQGGSPISCVVLVDKHGIEEIYDIPVYSLISTVQVDHHE